MYQLLKLLTATHAPSGRETRLAALIREKIVPLADEVTRDPLGNILAKWEGTGQDKKKVLYCAHMDEVGYIVTFVEENGYIRFSGIGKPCLTSAAYQEVIFENGVRGHIVPHTGSDTSLQYHTMAVDIGAKNKKEALKKVKPGDSFSVMPHITRLCGSMIGGRPLDNRIGCTILLKAAEDFHKNRPCNDIWLAFTVQEEITGNGAAAVACSVRPDIGFAVDTCGTGDTLDAFPMETKCGDGAAILIRDSTLIGDRDLVEIMFATAREKGIRHQTEIYTQVGSDAFSIQKTAAGVKTSGISVPTRYLHTAAEVLDLKDAEECRKLVIALASVDYSSVV